MHQHLEINEILHVFNQNCSFQRELLIRIARVVFISINEQQNKITFSL